MLAVHRPCLALFVVVGIGPSAAQRGAPGSLICKAGVAQYFVAGGLALAACLPVLTGDHPTLLGRRFALGSSCTCRLRSRIASAGILTAGWSSSLRGRWVCDAPGPPHGRSSPHGADGWQNPAVSIEWVPVADALALPSPWGSRPAFTFGHAILHSDPAAGQRSWAATRQTARTDCVEDAAAARPLWCRWFRCRWTAHAWVIAEWSFPVLKSACCLGGDACSPTVDRRRPLHGRALLRSPCGHGVGPALHGISALHAASGQASASARCRPRGTLARSSPR